jgi:hypothetical protein
MINKTFQEQLDDFLNTYMLSDSKSEDLKIKEVAESVEYVELLLFQVKRAIKLLNE